ncbi:uncharacterized protein LOC143256354 isoform X3 [Tachypleus tridentatus]|uniref:uncharacterized protein LOC143256354 isoform X3 n=1 Tax=Tachypleus tridentatus TaxID=6853 RepID=UPI003FCF4F17
MKFSIPRIWHEPTDHSNNCYFCMVDSSKHQAGKNASAGVFVGPQIKKILECTEFPKNLSRKEKKPWGSFVTVVRGFLGNCKAENVVELVEALVKNYSIMGCRMSLKVHILDAHLDKFKEDMGAYSEEKVMEKYSVRSLSVHHWTCEKRNLWIYILGLVLCA